MTLRTTITFTGPCGNVDIDGRAVRGLRGSEVVTIYGQPVEPTVDDVTERREEAERYLTRLTGLGVRIETDVA